LLFYCFLGLSLVILGSGAFLYYQFLQAAGERHSTNYKIYSQAPFNQPSYYPLNQPISSRHYQPVGTWTGRLILPTKEQRQTVNGVLFEVHHADAAPSEFSRNDSELEVEQ
jgi:predicted Abi (CAAX) family protease